MTKEELEEGQILLVNKPFLWTSFDVVKKLRNVFKIKKIGHAGTLDPLATGLMLIGTGKSTKKLNELQGLDKSYTGIIEIGKTTPSYDLETEFDSQTDPSSVAINDLENARRRLSGEIVQVPPAHSAVKVEGKRAYTMARNNEKVELKPRHVIVYEFKIFTDQTPEVPFEIKCSKGTYIRSIAHDFGQYLGVGAYLKSLKRTSIGPYSLQHAQEIDSFVLT